LNADPPKSSLPEAGSSNTAPLNIAGPNADLPTVEEDLLHLEEEVGERPRITPPWPVRVMRGIMRRMGLRTGKPAAVCMGVTRQGTACRGLAMANGYCRMHGGSRHEWVKGGLKFESKFEQGADQPAGAKAPPTREESPMREFTEAGAP